MRTHRLHRSDTGSDQNDQWLRERGFFVFNIGGTFDRLVYHPRYDEWVLLDWKCDKSAPYRPSQVNFVMEVLPKFPNAPILFASVASEVEDYFKRRHKAPGGREG